jgi:hypothetical protein
MFSAAQVEFVRYWLVNMGIGTQDEILIPNSSYLLRQNIELSVVSPAIYQNANSLKDAHKVKVSDFYSLNLMSRTGLREA